MNPPRVRQYVKPIRIARQREHLADFDADVEAHDVRHESLRREREILKLGGEAKAMKQAEDEHGDLRVGLNSRGIV